MEGVMMRGKSAYATAVRDPLGKIQVESVRTPSSDKKSRFSKLPFIRGVVNFVSSLILGNKVLMRSADVAVEDDEQPSKAEKWLAEKHKIDLNAIFNGISVVIGVLLAVVIFIWLPQFLTDLTGFDKTSVGLDGLWYNLTEGGIRIAVFVVYVLLTSLMPSMRRVFMYHGA